MRTMCVWQDGGMCTGSETMQPNYMRSSELDALGSSRCGQWMAGKPSRQALAHQHAPLTVMPLMLVLVPIIFVALMPVMALVAPGIRMPVMALVPVMTPVVVVATVAALMALMAPATMLTLVPATALVLATALVEERAATWWLAGMQVRGSVSAWATNGKDAGRRNAGEMGGRGGAG